MILSSVCTQSDIPKTAIITPCSSYVFQYSTFGLKNSGTTFQRMMDYIFGQHPSISYTLMTCFVFSDNNMEHELHLGEMLSLLRENRLIVRPDKCTFAATDSRLPRPSDQLRWHTPTPIQSVKQYKITRSQLRPRSYTGFLSMVNYIPPLHPHGPIVHHLIWKA